MSRIKAAYECRGIESLDTATWTFRGQVEVTITTASVGTLRYLVLRVLHPPTVSRRGYMQCVTIPYSDLPGVVSMLVDAAATMLCTYLWGQRLRYTSEPTLEEDQIVQGWIADGVPVYLISRWVGRALSAIRERYGVCA